MDVTQRLIWFLSCLGRAIENAQSILASVLAKARFWERKTCKVFAGYSAA
jgi:hypothetical protein